ncbi:MAG: type II toxin-antitoxin system HicB family antitoxin [Aphanizomenon sp.]
METSAIGGRKRRYTVVIEKGNTSYGAYVPDLPGCIAVAETLTEVQQMIVEAIEFHIEGLIESGLPIPQPTSIAQEVEVLI